MSCLSCNAPDPLLDGPTLPTFRYALEESPGKVIGGSYGKEATVAQLPISKGLAGVSMQLAPGAMRELHWHATAAEWGFVTAGRVRTTVIDPEGCAETNDFVPGDIWYFPRGHGHMLQCLGRDPCHFILIFDNGYFSEFGTFSVTDWMGHTPAGVLARNFGVPSSTFATFPTSEVYFASGVMPPEPPLPDRRAATPPPLSHRFPMLAAPPHRVFAGGREWRVDSASFPVAATITGVVLELEPGALRELHWHPTADEWQYVLAGTVDIALFGSRGRHRVEQLARGDVGYIPQGYGHWILNRGDEVARLLLGFNTGRYASIDLSMWLAANPPDVLATTFGQADGVFAPFPTDDVFIAPDRDAK